MDQMERYMKELRLQRIPEIYREEAEKAAKGKLDYVEYLHRLVEDEYLSKIERSVNMRIRRASFPFVKTIDEYDFTFQPQLNDKLIRRLSGLDYLDDATCVLFVGPPGVGKTHLAIGLGIKACQSQKRVKFYHARELMDLLNQAQIMGTLGKELYQLGKLDLLIIDELGYSKLSRENSSVLFQLVCRRYEKGSIILTSNCPFEDWGKIFEDSVMATAILDRLLHHSHVIYITGKSYRMKDYEVTLHYETSEEESVE